jgi:hypothetical protein
VGRFIERAEGALAKGAAPARLADLECLRPLARMGEDVGNDELDRLEALGREIERQFNTLSDEDDTEARDATAAAR